MNWCYCTIVINVGFSSKLFASIAGCLTAEYPSSVIALKVLHSIRALISLYFLFFFWNILESFSLICHISGFCIGNFSQILKGSLNFSV